MTEQAHGEPDPPKTGSGHATVPVWVLPTVTGVAGLLVGLMIGGIAVGTLGNAQRQLEAAASSRAASEGEAVMFRNAVRSCGANQSYAVVGDQGRSLTIEHQGEEDHAGISATDLWCIIETLDAPTSVISHMEQTTSLDGRQTETWDNIQISWSYHPDRGMDSILTLTDQ